METFFNRNYIKDIYGNLHQKISYNNYGKLLNYYKKHIYINGKFHDNSIISHKKIFDVKKDISKATFYANILYEILQENIIGKSILELGCGNGSFLNEIQNRYDNINCIGWDISEGAQEIANILWGNKKVNIIETEILRHINYLKPNLKWDIVIAFDFIEHIRFDKLLLNNLKFLLNHKGVCLVEVPVFPTDNIPDLLVAPYLYPEHHLHLYSYNGFSQLADECDWKIKERFTFDNNKKAFYLLELK